MTGAQHSYLKTLSEQVHQSDAYAEDLTKAEASTAMLVSPIAMTKRLQTTGIIQ